MGRLVGREHERVDELARQEPGNGEDLGARDHPRLGQDADLGALGVWLTGAEGTHARWRGASAGATPGSDSTRTGENGLGQALVQRRGRRP